MPTSRMEEIERLRISAINNSMSRAFSRLSIPVWMTSVFALSIGVMTIFHEMWRDELQAWLIARDSSSISNIFWNLRYEGHPVLWYLLLYPLAHISWNPVSMQVLNNVIAVLEAWFIMRETRMSLLFRVAIVFSGVSYMYATLARSYMLSAFLLTAAMCFCVRERKWIGILFLVLAINAHFFAIPIALLIYIFFYVIQKGEERRPLKGYLRRAFILPAVLIAASLTCSYFTIRPRPDSYTPHYGDSSPVKGFLISSGNFWTVFLPVPKNYLPANMQQMLMPHTRVSIVAIAVSLAAIMLLLQLLRTLRARVFFLVAVLLELLAYSLTVHVAAAWHMGFLLYVFALALIMDSHQKNGVGRSWLTPRFSDMAVTVLIVLNSMIILRGALQDVLRPFSGAKETAQWIERMGLKENSLVIPPEATAIIGYMEKDKAYFPSCNCFESYYLYNKAQGGSRIATKDELNALAINSRKRVLVVVHDASDQKAIADLHLVLLYRSRQDTMVPDERFAVYAYPGEGSK